MALVFYYNDMLQKVRRTQQFSAFVWICLLPKEPNLVPRAHVPFGQQQDTELWNNKQARSQELVPRAFVAFAFKI